MQKRHIIYNSESWDSVLCAAILHKKYKDAAIITENELSSANIAKFDMVFVVGTTLDEETMLAFDKEYKLFWIHNDDEARANKKLKNIRGQRGKDIAACMLTFSFANSFSMIPKSIRYFNDYSNRRKKDRKKWREELLPFAFGLSELDKNPKNELIQSLITKGGVDFALRAIIVRGKKETEEYLNKKQI